VDSLDVLLTNDDGVAREGLRLLRDELVELGAKVTVLAPDGNRSGLGRGITLDHPVGLHRVDGEDENPVYACSGTPVDCVRIALLSSVCASPEVVVSGINHGLNVGDDSTYSGTVGAALEGALLGVPAVAFSQQPEDGSFRFNDSGVDVSFAFARVAARIVSHIAERPLPAGAVLNINFPAGEDAEDIVATRPGRRRFYRLRSLRPTGPTGSLEFYPYGVPTDGAGDHEDEEDTDFGALRAGKVSVSLLWAHYGAVASAFDFDSYIADLGAAGIRNREIERSV
jgi:5'/3'-nucleotidase